MTEEKKHPLHHKRKSPEQQKKGALIYAGVVSVIALGIVIFLALRPSHPTTETQNNQAVATTTQSASGTNPIASFLSNFKIDFGAIGKGSTIGPGTAGGQNQSGGMFSVGQTNMFNLGTSNYFTIGQAPTGSTYVPPGTVKSPGNLELETTYSPLYGKIKIGGVYRGADQNHEYVTLTTTSTLPQNTLLTGLVLKSLASGQTVELGKGVYLYFANEINEKVPLYINPGARITVVTGTSPIGYSFLVNKCTGYLDQFQTYIPSLPHNCPALKNEPLPKPPNQLSDWCLDYIDRFPVCRIATGLTTYTDQGYDCIKFITDNTGYANCSKLHHYDSNFYSNDWRIYLGRNQRAWKDKREIIWLLDQDGKFISQYSY